MAQAAAGQGLSLDPLPFEQDRLTTTEGDVGWGEIAQALMSAGAVVVLHKGPDLRLQIARQVVVLQQDAVLQRLMPALDLDLLQSGGAAEKAPWQAPDQAAIPNRPPTRAA